MDLPDRIEYAARALSPFVWDPDSAQSKGEPHAIEAQRQRSISRVRRIIAALEEWDRLAKQSSS